MCVHTCATSSAVTIGPKGLPRLQRKRKHFVISSPHSQESHPFSTHSVARSPRATMDTAPFQQLESDKIQHLLAEGLDSLRLHSAVRDCPETALLCELKRGWQLSWERGAWGSYYLCSLAPMHFFVLAFQPRILVKH